ncbi:MULTISPECIES: hypothetical protein [unclassified Butyrivibrio]|uniref:hypothetical protein n=1 Tax=unclassified Butyrivibrio TaxID=2639466 RepID=UPI0003F57C45|nr:MULTISPECIES: hypothetical protein [unclassified Butyrivibrio]SDB63293.1 hypothetical protein SAMN02910263_03471 [Butyrivibrio sp. INlla16]
MDEEVKKGYFSVLRLGFLIAAVIFVALTGVLFFISSRYQKYETVQAYITDVSSRYRTTDKGLCTEYTYMVHWFYDGKWHVSKELSEEIEPDINLSQVKVNPATQKIMMKDTGAFLVGAIAALIVAILCLIAFISLTVITKTREKEFTGENGLLGEKAALTE